MLCNDFKCVYEVDGECELDGGQCVGDLCDNWGECIGCQQQDKDECEGLRNG